MSVSVSLDTETVKYDHYLRLGGALNFEFSLKKKKENIYIQLGGPLKLFTSSKGYLSNTLEQPFKSEPYGYIQRQNSHSYSTQTRLSIAQVRLEWD